MTAVAADRDREYRRCPTPNSFTGSSCKRRGCPVCGVPWAKSVGTVNEKGLEALGGSVVMIAITPPGQDVLPWACRKEHRDRHGSPLPHSGKRGCKIDDEAADRWSEDLSARWKKLRDAARKAVERAGFPRAGLAIDRFYEPQKRGIAHLHVIAAARTPIEYAAANRFAEELHRLAPEYGFGFVDRGNRTKNQACPVRNHRDRSQLGSCICSHALPTITAQEARRYLVSYLTGRSGKKNTIRENISHPRMPRSLWWISPALTSLSTNARIEGMRERLGVEAGTGITMRRLRLVRWYYACLQGRCSIFPRLFGQDILDVALVAVRTEPKKSRAPGETDEAAFRRHLGNLHAMRLIQEPFSHGSIGGRHAPIDVAPAEEPKPVPRDPYMQIVLDIYQAQRRPIAA